MSVGGRGEAQALNSKKLLSSPNSSLIVSKFHAYNVRCTHEMTANYTYGGAVLI